MTNKLPPMYSQPEVAEILGITVRRVMYLAAHEAGFPSPVAIGKRYYFLKDAVDMYVAGITAQFVTASKESV